MPALTVEDREGARWITLDRPPANVLDLPTIRELDAALEPLPARRDLKVVVLQSALEGTFSAGVDVRDHARERVPEMLRSFHGIFRRLDALPQASVAAVSGRCLAGGCELAAFCDIVLASPQATFGQPEIDVGCFPPLASVLLPRLVGRAAMEMILTGAVVGAAEAARAGLVTRVVEDLATETARVAAVLAAKSRAVLAIARRAARHGADGAFFDALERAEALYRNDLLSTRDVEEGVRAFVEKRAPRWSDE